MMPPPKRKNPLRRTPAPLLPPSARSRTALGITAAAAWGRFELQVCVACGVAQYPPREVCGACLGDELAWRGVDPMGELIAATTVHVSGDSYFRERTPWRVGTVAMDAGQVVIAHLVASLATGDRVRLAQKLDRAGQGVMVALPLAETVDLLDDPMMREMTCDPRDRRVLVTDGRHLIGQAIARVMLAAGARVLLGVAEMWKPFAAVDGAEMIELDLSDADSVRRCAAAYGGRVEIVVNTGLHTRPGGILARGDLTTARVEMEAAYFGPMRLAQALGPALRSRAADGTHPTCAWVNVLSVYALANLPNWGASCAAQAAGMSLSQALRADLRPIRVINALVGPLDDEWHQDVPPPKVTADALATAIVKALRDGVEDVAVGDVARDVLARWLDDPKTLERELAT